MSYVLTFAILGALLSGAGYLTALAIRCFVALVARVVDGISQGFQDQPHVPQTLPLKFPQQHHEPPEYLRSAPEEAWSAPSTATDDQVISRLLRVYAAHLEGVAFCPRTPLDEAICERGVETERFVRQATMPWPAPNISGIGTAVLSA